MDNMHANIGAPFPPQNNKTRSLAGQNLILDSMIEEFTKDDVNRLWNSITSAGVRRGPQKPLTNNIAVATETGAVSTSAVSTTPMNPPPPSNRFFISNLLK